MSSLSFCGNLAPNWAQIRGDGSQAIKICIASIPLPSCRLVPDDDRAGGRAAERDALARRQPQRQPAPPRRMLPHAEGKSANLDIASGHPIGLQNEWKRLQLDLDREIQQPIPRPISKFSESFRESPTNNFLFANLLHTICCSSQRNLTNFPTTFFETMKAGTSDPS